MSQSKGEPIMYKLYGVIVNNGHSSDHGHYFSYCKANESWYCFDDSEVHQVNTETVFNCDADHQFLDLTGRGLNFKKFKQGPNVFITEKSYDVRV